MSQWIYPNELANGDVTGIPKISIALQNNLRRLKGSLTQSLDETVYKREWIEEYLNGNTREATPKVS